MHWVIMFLILFVDQWTKWMVLTKMQVGASIPVWGTFFSITSHRNSGAAWGLFQDQTTLLIVLGGAMMLFIGYAAWRSLREHKMWRGRALILILGGGMGNLIDRVRLGEVVDFFHVVFDFRWMGIDWQYGYPIFNVADAMIVSGVFLLVLELAREEYAEWRQRRVNKLAITISATKQRGESES